MMEQNESLIFGEKELQVLLAGMGFSQVYGLFSEQVTQREEILQTMVALVRKKHLKAQDDGLHLDTQLRELLQDIGTAEKLLLITAPGQQYCCYCGEQPIICQPVRYSPGMLRLTRMSAKALLEELDADEVLPEDTEQTGELTEELLWEDNAQELLRAELRSGEQTVLTAAVRDSVVREREIYIEWQDGNHQLLPYSRELFAVQLTQLLTGEFS